MRYPKEEIERYRQSAGELENVLIDDFNDGLLTRSELIRRGSVLGISIPLLGLIAGVPLAAASPQAPARKTAGTMRIGHITVDGSLEPPLLQSLGALGVSHLAGEQLLYADKNAVLRPLLATSWKASNNAKTWTFNLRKNVKFHDGSPLTADDVVATFKILRSKDSQALQAYKGILGGVRKVNATTVAFDMVKPNGLFPYLLGQMVYQAIILPKTYKLPSDITKPGDWTANMNGTGPFRLKENRGAAGFTFEANPSYWGGKPSIDTVTIQLLDDQARVTALQSGQIDLATQITYQGAQQLESAATVLPLRAANHRYLNMNVTKAPFNDPRVREAFALALNRPSITTGLWGKYGEVGNDSPLWPGYPYTDKSVRQRTQDLKRARQLLQSAGKEGLKVTLTCYRAFEMPDYAQRVAQDLKKIGVNCSVKVYTSAQYFDGVSFGATGKLAPWLGTDFGIVDYGGRPVPITYFNAALRKGGVWNAARYANPQFEKLVNDFYAAPDLKGQKKYAGAIQRLLLKDTPAIYSYFYNFIAASGKNVNGYVPDGMGWINLRKVTVG
ncbi:MAG TPA: ABC transporter substrate-binding protein [Gaiellaceae bacterium]|nr:ABC transporter substrate-binding protein [Gaiellaceae bacterium]